MTFMKKLYFLFACAAVSCSASLVSAQLPDPAFTNWVDCIPWTSNGNTTVVTTATGSLNDVPETWGTQPEGWFISNVIGINGMGATVIGGIEEGIDGGKAVGLLNKSNPYMKSQIVPGYLTLGTTWSTAVGWEVLKGNFANSDGGTFGGVKCESRPDAVSFYYKRSLAEGNTQCATIVAYSWTGTYTQKDVPANIVFTGSPVKVDMVNRDRNILGMETIKGGEVTTTEGAGLVSKLIYQLNETSADWTALTLPLEYVSDSKPEMFNIIIAANDYFNSEKIEKGNTLSVAQPKLLYYSKLSSLEVAGQPVKNFDSAVYNYELDELPAIGDLTWTLAGKAAVAKAEQLDGKIVITVTNNEGTDEEDLSEHVYTLTKAADEPVGTAENYKGKLVVNMGGTDVSSEGGDDATLSVTPTGEGLCTVCLPQLILGDLGDLGEIKVENVKCVTENTITTYAATVKDFPVLGGAIIAQTIEVSGTTENGVAKFIINVTCDGLPPIVCTFNGKVGITAIDAVEVDNNEAPVEYYDLRGIRVNPDNMTNGIYVRRQGTNTSKIIIR